MSKKQKHITIASFNYLNEISAIPAETRRKYLDKLLRRKNSSFQKNVRLLMYIYRLVDEEKISTWEPRTACIEAGITMKELYDHKSRLLKGLREIYFNWKQIEKEIEESSTRVVNKFNESEYIIELDLAKARKMAELGMMREAKKKYVKVEKIIGKANMDKELKYIIKSEIYEYLAYYHFNRRQKNRVLNYVDKLEEAYRVLKMGTANIQEKHDALFKFRVYYSKFYLYCIEWYSNPKAKMPDDYHKRMYELSTRFQFHDSFLKVLHNKAIFEMVKNNYSAAKEICLEGYRKSIELKKNTARYTFASMLYFLKKKTEGKNIRLDNESILQNYHRIKRNEPLNLWTTYLENSLSMSYHPEKKQEILEVLREQINTNILMGDYEFAVFWRFTLDTELYNEKFLTYFNDTKETKDYLEIGGIDKDFLDNIERSCLNTECYQKRLNDFGLLWLLYKLQFTANYFREGGSDFEKVKNIINKMERMKKSEKITSALSTFELLKLAIKMLEHSIHPKYMLSRFEFKFKRMIDSFKKNITDFSITDYAIISSLARRLKCREITNIVKDFYNWLSDNHPEILKPVFREIEERKAQVYTITGKEEAA